MRHFFVWRDVGRLVLFAACGSGAAATWGGPSVGGDAQRLSEVAARTRSSCPRSLRPRAATRSRSPLARTRAASRSNASVKLVGAGAGQTVISGGGPVLTIGTFGALTEPTVSIDGVDHHRRRHPVEPGIDSGSMGRRVCSRPVAASRSHPTPTSAAARRSRSGTVSSPATLSRRPTPCPSVHLVQRFLPVCPRRRRWDRQLGNADAGEHDGERQPRRLGVWAVHASQRQLSAARS